jgi:hypothetical protein
VAAHRRYKPLAFKWHPDRNPDNPEVEEKFKLLTPILSDLDRLKLIPPGPQPIVRVIHFPRTSPFGGSVTTSTTSTTSTTASTASTAAFNDISVTTFVIR